MRRFSASGGLEWEYQHRSEASTAKHAAVFDGSLWVLVEVRQLANGGRPAKVFSGSESLPSDS